MMSASAWLRFEPGVRGLILDINEFFDSDRVSARGGFWDSWDSSPSVSGTTSGSTARPLPLEMMGDGRGGSDWEVDGDLD